MSTQHTPGPWIVRSLSGYPYQIATAPESDGFGTPIADMSYNTKDPACLPNARLIAAAPDLLQSLQAIVARIELANTEGDPIASAWLPDARATIARATEG